MEEAVAEGIRTDAAELLYDIALEEGLDPAIGLELVRARLAVAPPHGDEGPADAPATDRYLPAWIFPATPPARLEQERTMRVSFRRLRGFLESQGDVEAAFRRFAAEPDVGYHDY
jgi:hypothetical protein